MVVVLVWSVGCLVDAAASSLKRCYIIAAAVAAAFGQIVNEAN